MSKMSFSQTIFMKLWRLVETSDAWLTGSRNTVSWFTVSVSIVSSLFERFIRTIKAVSRVLISPLTELLAKIYFFVFELC
jgi:hypothetical protein